MKYILWGEPWVNFLLALADAPRYVSGKRTPVVSSTEEAAKILGNKHKISVKNGS